jgi:hypothetical protein
MSNDSPRALITFSPKSPYLLGAIELVARRPK